MPDHATLSATQTCREMSRWPGRLELAKVPHLVLLTPAICKDCNTVTNHPESICFPASMEDVGWVLRYYLHLFALHSYQNSFKSQVTGPDYFGLLFTLISVYLVIFTSFSFIWHSFDWRQDLCHSIDRLKGRTSSKMSSQICCWHHLQWINDERFGTANERPWDYKDDKRKHVLWRPNYTKLHIISIILLDWKWWKRDMKTMNMKEIEGMIGLYNESMSPHLMGKIDALLCLVSAEIHTIHII